MARLLLLVALVGGALNLISETSSAQSFQRSLLAVTNEWRYNQTVSYNGSNWTAANFDDSTLPSGRGVLAYESNNVFVTSRTNTFLSLGRLTYYFRTRFVFTNSPVGVSLVFSNLLDDGAVFYLNGVELRRLYLPPPPATISYTNLASSHEATAFEEFTVSGPSAETNLVYGTNVLAVEVHQQGPGSSDIVFGLGLSAIIPDPNPPPTLRMPQQPPSYGYSFSNAFEIAFAQPVAITTPPGETNRLFVLEQEGRIAIITNLANPTRSVFLDISSRIIYGGEQGLLGLAFHPGYVTNRQFYIFYTVNATTAQGANAPHDRLSRMLASATNSNVADGTSEFILFEQRDEAGNHNGGDLHFGPDGYLYVSLGDEGGANDTYQNSQRIDRDFFAGLLRIDVDDRPTSLLANPHPANTNNPARTVRYRIPPDNPWVGATNFNGATVNPANVRTEFYAAGLRNPWRFSFDGTNLYLADVGQDVYEEVNLVRRGGNYGWNYREALHAGPRANPPAGVVFDQPIVEYSHGGGTNQGLSVTGGVVYRGSQLPDLVGWYIFADYISGNVWALRANGTNVVPFPRLTSIPNPNIAGFGIDPRNGDVLAADQGASRIKRLVEDRSISVGSSLPPSLFHTGAFTNLYSLASETDALTPNAGVRAYDINVPFWSDNARKTRWVFRSNTNLQFGFSPQENWSFPTGTVWVKHFDLELTNGVPSSTKRIETRLLVRNSGGLYGVTYRWGDSVTNATLVGDEGMDETFTINDGGILRTQVWHYPSRGECLTCHTPVAGLSLGFNTAQLNRDVDLGAGPTNQIAALIRAGYLSSPPTSVNVLPALAHATNEAWSAEWRVRSYLAANCSQCHQPGGVGGGTWDARYHNPLSASGLIRGHLNDNQGDTNNRVVVPGSLAHSMLLTRISIRGDKQMPPLATSVLDTQAITLVSAWITNDLGTYRTFEEWQVQHFGGINEPGAGRNDDPDLDGASNFLEWLTGTDPLEEADAWRIAAGLESGVTQIQMTQVANRGFQLEWTRVLSEPPLWQPLDVPENRSVFSPTNRPVLFELPTSELQRLYRVRVFEP